ncbi:MAG: cytochrome C oxidase subunit IV family protein [Candidatus Acidiferrales bacterium]
MSNQVPGMKFNVAIWIVLLVIVAIEVVLTLQHPPARTLLVYLLCLAFIEAGLGVMYFMHLKYENSKLFWTMVPIVIFVLFMMDHIWPDAFRMARMSMLK